MLTWIVFITLFMTLGTRQTKHMDVFEMEPYLCYITRGTIPAMCFIAEHLFWSGFVKWILCYVSFIWKIRRTRTGTLIKLPGFVLLLLLMLFLVSSVNRSRCVCVWEREREIESYTRIKCPWLFGLNGGHQIKLKSLSNYKKHWTLKTMCFPCTG